MATIMVILCFSLAIGQALADTTTVGPGEVFFERRSATTGARLSWSWHSSLSMAFSVSRTDDHEALLYASEGTDDSGHVDIAFDDVYVLLWYNPSNTSANLNYTSTIEPGPGSPLLPLAVILILVVVILLAIALTRRRSKMIQGKEDDRDKGLQTPPGPSMVFPSATEQSVQPRPSPGPPPGAPQSSEGAFCQYCVGKVRMGAAFCSGCGSRLN